MTTSPLQFAQSFQQLKSKLQSRPAGDLRLLLLVEFWPSLSVHVSDNGYRSYFDEYIPLLIDHVTARNLEDLLPEELKKLLDVFLALRRNEFAQESADAIERCIDLVATEAARKFFYVGAVDDGLDCLSGAKGTDESNSWAADVPLNSVKT